MLLVIGHQSVIISDANSDAGNWGLVVVILARALHFLVSMEFVLQLGNVGVCDAEIYRCLVLTGLA